MLARALVSVLAAGLAAVLAALARQPLGLPSAVIRSSPAQNALQLTNSPTW